ncbi:MAG: carbohydrate-binding module family 14 protein [Rikenellaceae bacterium]|nr:carbohydrate-binding module family 14 protein [Rikenellaceae bacterium]
MKKVFKIFFPNKFFMWANGIMMGALILMFGGMIYMKSVIASTGSDPVPECPTHIDFEVFFPHPDDCCLFYMCLDGVAYLIPCPAPLHYSPMYNVCTYPEFAECIHYDPSNN